MTAVYQPSWILDSALILPYMKTNTQAIKLIVATVLVAFGISAQAQTVNPMPNVNNNWRFSGTISGWAPASWATVTTDHLTKSADSSISDNIKSAGGMAMLTAEAHKGDWGLMGDLVYWQMLGDSNKVVPILRGAGSVDVGTNSKTTQTMLTVAATYTAYNSPSLYLDGLAGARYISSTSTLAATGNLSVDAGGRVVSTSVSRYPSRVDQTTDPVIGFKGRARISDTSWFVPFYADVGKGPGSNNTTWQALVGVGNAYSWGDVTLAYRAMYFDLEPHIGTTKFLNAGPQLSATVNF